MPDDINDRIALAKGWKWRPKAQMYVSPNGSLYADAVPNYVGTLEGVSGMLRELGPKWVWGWDGIDMICYREPNPSLGEWFTSSVTCPGDCVGEAYMSIKGAVDAL